jgi:hypothetical protein
VCKVQTNICQTESLLFQTFAEHEGRMNMVLNIYPRHSDRHETWVTGQLASSPWDWQGTLFSPK